jgi:hypothetical protein
MKINLVFLYFIYRIRGKSIVLFPLKNHRRRGNGFPSTEHGKRRCSPFLYDCSMANIPLFSFVNLGGTKNHQINIRS